MAVGITCNNPPAADIGAAYTHAFPATGDTPPDVFDIPSGALPAGLTIDAATGIVSGTPTGPAGLSTFAVRVTDSLAGTATANCTIFVNGQLQLVGQPVDGYLGLPYAFQFTAIGGDLPYIFSLGAGALPNGISLNLATGKLSGIPLVLGLFVFTVTLTDALGTVVNLLCQLWVRPVSHAGSVGPQGVGTCA